MKPEEGAAMEEEKKTNYGRGMEGGEGRVEGEGGGEGEEGRDRGGEGKAVVVANTHILFNPKRGDIKLQQVSMKLYMYVCVCVCVCVYLYI